MAVPEMSVAGVALWTSLLAVAAAIVLWTPFRRRIYVIVRMLPRDLKFVYRFGLVLLTGRLMQWRNATVVSKFLGQLAAHPTKPCFIFDDKIWTFADVESYSNKMARIMANAGYKKGDVIGLMMENRPEFVCIWLGMAKIGVVTALINTNVRDGPLAHVITTARCRAVIVSPTFCEAVREVKEASVRLIQWKEDFPILECPDDPTWPLASASIPGTPLENVPTPGYRDELLYIFTSGTTGLPKAAVMLHSRYLLMAMASKYVLALGKDDVLYNPLPQYHTAGGVLGTGAAVVNGIACVLRTKFSASAYIPDCIKYKCTVGQYIGEICRYLLALEPRPEDTQHSLRLLVGNGMRPAIWKSFVERFKVDQICEVYGATEGNTNIVNIDNTIGAVGCLPRFLPDCVFPVAIIRVDPESGLPIRGPDGFCQRCDYDEPGMFIGLIDDKNAMREFHGYLNEEESRKKVLKDVFRKGDKAYLSGDLLVMDEDGYLYFKDRTGDTFRWKGENVSTTEVESIIISVVGLKNATVYGVEIPGTEGRAGMAAIEDPEGVLDLNKLAQGVKRSLPAYARPIFLRVTSHIEHTGTFKMKKINLQRIGFNPAHTGSDRLYVLQGEEYVNLTDELYKDIVAGKLRL